MNVLTDPLSGNIYFDSCASQHTSTPNLTGTAVALGFDGCAGLTVTSYNADSQDRLTVAGSSGSLFSVNDSLTGTVFSVNDAAGLPIIEVNSDATTDTIAIGEYGTNALFVCAGNVGIGTTTPTSPLHVCGNITVTGTVDGRDIVADGSKLDGIACGAGAGTVTEVRGCTNISVTNGTSIACVNMSTGGIGSGTYGNTGNSCKIDSITVDAYGRVTAVACGPTGCSNANGTVTSIATGTGIGGGTITGSGTLTVGAGTGLCATADGLCIATACDTAWHSCATSAQGTKADNALPKAGGSMSGHINMCNYNICNVNTILFADPGPSEGLTWSGGNTKIFESPDNLTTNSAGNLQMVYGSTRRLTVNNTGIDVNGNIVVSGTVDGRDIAADGAKLNSIACNATNVTNNNQLTNGAGYITSSSTNTLTNKTWNGVAIADAYIASASCWNACATSTQGGKADNALPKAGGTMTGTINSRDIKLASNYHLQRSNHHSGHLEGSYTNIGANEAKTNPIYTIGSAYNPSDNSLGTNMYGIGFSRETNASFLNFTGASGWGLYVAADGDARVFLDGSNGIVTSTGEHYVGSSRVFHDTYHPNADILTTARTIAGSSFNGSANININYNCLTNKPTIPTNNSQLSNGCSYIKSCDSITGNAATATNSTCAGGLAIHGGQGTQNNANQILRTQANGYAMLGWINTSSGNNGSCPMDRIYASTDQYIRYYTPACFGAQIGSHINYNCLLNKPTIPTGDITGVTAGTGMTGGGSSGSVTLNVIGGDGITANADNIVVDSTVVRTTGAQTIAGVKTYSSRGDFSNADGVRTNQLRTYGGQQLVLNAGESSSYATGQTAECVFINAEAGLEINSSPDNWSSGWAGRRTSYINNTSGNSHFYGSITLGGNVDGRNVANDGAKLDGIACGATANNGDITNVTASNGLCGGGSSGSVTICHCDTSSQGSVNNSNGTVIQDVTLDTYGHVTALGSCDLDNRYYTKGTIDGAFLRSNQNDSFTGQITMGTQKALIANNYGRGVYGLYNSGKYQHVWSMGTSYNLCDNGSGSGNLYGLAFTHTNVGGQSKAGLSHQLLVMHNGSTVSAIGSGIWTSGTITANNGNIVLNGTGRIQGIDTVSSGTDAANKTYVDNGLACKQAAGTYNTIIGTDSDINTSGCTVIDCLNMTDGVIQSHTTRSLTLANLGYTGATNANYITNNNQLTNGAGYTTCTGTGDITAVVAGTDLSGGATSGSATLNVTSCVAASNNTLVKRHSSGYIFANYFNTTANDVSSGVTKVMVETGNDNYIRHGSAGAIRTFINVANGATACTGTTTASNSQTFTNKGGNISQWTNNSGYTSCAGTTTASNSQTFTNKGGCISQWSNNSGYTTCTGNVVTSGSTFTGNITLNDNVRARFGNSADLDIYHNGSHSYIDNDKNSLYIRNNVDGDDGGNIIIMPHDNETGIIIHDDGAVCLYSDNAVKLCTQSYGAKTQGTHCSSFDMKAPIGCFCTMGIGGQSRQSSYALVAGNCGSCCGGGSAKFCGTVQVCGSFSKSSGCFDIAHPLPALSATKRLSHSFVESPQADNIYSGVVDLTAGKATVNIDQIHGMTNGTLTALNRCFRTFTTNETNWDPVRGSVTGNTLTVESCVADSTATVSWMVLGERHDPHMREIATTDDEGRARVEYTPPSDIYSDGDWEEL